MGSSVKYLNNHETQFQFLWRKAHSHGVVANWKHFVIVRSKTLCRSCSVYSKLSQNLTGFHLLTVLTGMVVGCFSLVANRWCAAQIILNKNTPTWLLTSWYICFTFIFLWIFFELPIFCSDDSFGRISRLSGPWKCSNSQSPLDPWCKK